MSHSQGTLDQRSLGPIAGLKPHDHKVLDFITESYDLFLGLAGEARRFRFTERPNAGHPAPQAQGMFLLTLAESAKSYFPVGITLLQFPSLIKA